MDYRTRFTGGEGNISNDDLARVQESNQRFITDFLKDNAQYTTWGNNNYVISGCVPTISVGTSISITKGYVFIQNEVVEVEAQSISHTSGQTYSIVKTDSIDADGTKVFKDGTTRNTWSSSRGVLTEVAFASNNIPIATSTDKMLRDRYLKHMTGVIERAGTIASYDFDISDFTLDLAVRELDLSSIVPQDARVAYLEVTTITGATAGDEGIIQFGSNAISLTARKIQHKCVVTSYAARNDAIVMCFLDENRKTQYLGTTASGAGFADINVVVKGWQF